MLEWLVQVNRGTFFSKRWGIKELIDQWGPGESIGIESALRTKFGIVEGIGASNRATILPFFRDIIELILYYLSDS
jgi:hypothetical protein